MNAGFTYSRYIIGSSLGTCEDETFASFIIHDLLEMLDESGETISTSLHAIVQR
jgi:hypothetical protein